MFKVILKQSILAAVAIIASHETVLLLRESDESLVLKAKKKIGDELWPCLKKY